MNENPTIHPEISIEIRDDELIEDNVYIEIENADEIDLNNDEDTVEKYSCDICCELVDKKNIIINNCNCTNKQWCVDCLVQWSKNRTNDYNKCEICKSEFKKVIVDDGDIFSFISSKAFAWAKLNIFLILLIIGILSYYSDGKILMISPIFGYYTFISSFVIMGYIDRRNYLSQILRMNPYDRTTTKKVTVYDDEGNIINEIIVN